MDVRVEVGEGCGRGGNGVVVDEVKRLWRGKAKVMGAKGAVVVKCCRFGFVFGFVCAPGTASSWCSARRSDQ